MPDGRTENIMKFEREIPIRHSVDVFVAGGGPAGIAAALSASRSGASVYLAEKEQCFGGMATAAIVPAFMRFSDGINFLAGGIGREVFDALYGADADFTPVEFPIDTEKLKRIYDKMLTDSDVIFSFENHIISLEQKDGKVTHAVIMGKEKIFAVEAKIFIDATGDGTVAVWAGADFEIGDDEGRMMPGSLCTLWGNIDWSRAIVELGKDPDNRRLQDAFRDGVFTVQDPNLPGMWRRADNYGGGNIGHVFGVDGTDENSITKGMIDARARMPEYRTYYRNYLEGYENTELLASGAVLGIRESRRIKCDYMMSVNDYFSYADFEDEIGRYNYPIDVHAATAGGYSKYWHLYGEGYPKGKSYGISYRALLPEKTNNVLVCGRCVGAEREMMGSIRVMPGCFITGMAAGVAAAMSAKADCTPREIDVKLLQENLRAQGAFIPKK